MKPNNSFLITGYHSPVFFKNQNRELDEQTSGYLYDEFNGHTWYVQTLLNRLYGYREKIDIRMVNYAIEEVVAESTYTSKIY